SFCGRSGDHHTGDRLLRNRSCVVDAGGYFRPRTQDRSPDRRNPIRRRHSVYCRTAGAGGICLSVRRQPGGAKPLIVFACVVVGVEILVLSFVGSKAWGSVYFTPPDPDSLRVDVQAGQFAFYFRYPGPDGKFGPLHPELINEGSQNYFGLDPEHDADAKDNIVTAGLAIPVNKPVLLTLHSKDMGHSFDVRELRIQQDFVPGIVIPIHFTANQTGKFEIVCTQLCGLGHYNMKAYLEVMSQADYDNWLKQQAAMQ